MWKRMSQHEKELALICVGAMSCTGAISLIFGHVVVIFLGICVSAFISTLYWGAPFLYGLRKEERQRAFWWMLSSAILFVVFFALSLHSAATGG